MASVSTPHAAGRRVGGLRSHVGAQVGVGAGQVVAGVGNLAFSVLAARWLAPGDFAVLTAFLALSLLVAVPAGSLAAGSILSADLHDRVKRHQRRLGLGMAVALGGGVAVAGPTVGLPRSLAGPAAALPLVALGLALARARLYAHRRPGAVVGTLVAEPAVRLGLGAVLLVVLGATGGAVAVAVGGFAALLVAVRAMPDHAPVDAGRLTASAGAQGVGAFLALALVQNQDVLVVNARLPGDEAGTFAALSMLGGAALFAVWNAPLVLMPRAAEDDSALPAALGVTATAGAVATVVAFVLAPQLVELLVGGAYADAAGLLGPYVGAMALLGLARVLAGDRCARGRAASTAVIGGLFALAHVAMLLTVPDVGTATGATLATTAGLAATLGVAVAWDRTAPSLAAMAWFRERVWADTAARVATVATGVGLGARLLIGRGLWLDEATTVVQVNLPFGAMLRDIATVDVHPPLHQIVLWGWVRVFGDGELAVRMPFVLLGALVVPLLFLAGRDLYSRRVGAVAALLGAVAPMAVWYSQESRMYALYLLFSVLAIWGQGRAMRDGRWAGWAWFALGTAGLLWTHWFAGLQVATQQAVLLGHVVARRRAGHRVGPVLGRWAVTLVGIGLLVAPLVPLLTEQLAAYGQRGAGLDATPSQTGGAVSDATGTLSAYRFAVNLAWAVLGYHADTTMTMLVALWPLGMLAAFAALGRGPWRAPTWLLGAVALVPLVVLYGMSTLKANLFEIRYVIGVLPAILLLAARAVDLPRRVPARVLAGGALVLASTAGLVDQQVNEQNPRRYAFDEAVARVSADADPGDVVAVAPWYLEDAIEYYGPDLEVVRLSDVDPDEVDGTLHVVASFLENPEPATLVGERVTRLEQVRELVDEHKTGNVSIWTFR